MPTSNNTCIRLNRDETLIRAAKKRVKEIGSSILELSKILGLAGNEVRLKILFLLQEERLCVCDLSDVLDMKIPAVSQHLRKLKDAGLVVTQREGTIIYYRIAEDIQATLEPLSALIEEPAIPVGV